MAFNTKIPLSPDDPNEMILVHRGGTSQITANISEDELFAPKNGLDAHPLSMDTVRIVQAVRDYYGVPVVIMLKGGKPTGHSTYRNYVPTGEGVIDPAQKSPHMLALAIDFSFGVAKAKQDQLFIQMREDFEKKGELFQHLWSMGCRGYGVYDNFVHLDTVRPALYADFRTKRTERYDGEQFAYWNKQKTLRYKKATDNLIVGSIKEQGGNLVGLLTEIANSEDRGADIDFKHILRIVGMLTVGSTIIIGFFWLKRKLVL